MGCFFSPLRTYGRPLLLGCAAGVLLPLFGCSPACAAGETSTSMTVITATEVSGVPSSHLSYTVDTTMVDAEYTAGRLAWTTDPFPRKWGMTIPNGVTGNLWYIAPHSSDGYGGSTYKAISWDYVGNNSRSKHRASYIPQAPIFTMLSSLCEQGSGVCATPDKVRTSAVRWPHMFEPTGTLRINPPHIGVFADQEIQRFKLYDGNTEIPTNNVDWWISEALTDTQGFEPGQIASIDKNGVATVLSSRGTVKISACYPKGCGPNQKVVNFGAIYTLLLSEVR